jgi:hypothetical protein
MPAGLPGATPVQNAANPSTGTPVIFDLISGPKGSPKDNDKDYATGTGVANANASTGGLSTGIGFGLNVGPQGVPNVQITSGPTYNFTDDYTPGITKPDRTAGDGTMMYIGGGKSDAAGKTTTDPAGLSRNVPYTAGFGIGAAGGGGSRDAGAGPAFTGFTMKMVTAAADVAAAGVIETGFTNRSGLTIPLGMNQFGSGGTATVAPSMTKEEKDAAEHDRAVAAKALKEASEPEKSDDKEGERLKLMADMDKAAEKEDERIRKEREEGAKLPPVTGQVHIKETDDKVKFAEPKPAPKKEK